MRITWLVLQLHNICHLSIQPFASPSWINSLTEVRRPIHVPMIGYSFNYYLSSTVQLELSSVLCPLLRWLYSQTILLHLSLHSTIYIHACYTSITIRVILNRKGLTIPLLDAPNIQINDPFWIPNSLILPHPQESMDRSWRNIHTGPILQSYYRNACVYPVCLG